MQVKIQPWGNSLAIRLPKKLLEQANLKAGQSITLESENSGFKAQKKKYTLEALVAQITPENQHELFDSEPAGKEIIEDDYS